LEVDSKKRVDDEEKLRKGEDCKTWQLMITTDFDCVSV